jgi:hypothetical protein
MTRWPSRRPPKALRSPTTRFDNLAIVPASLLPNKASYQKYANTLPRGQVLLIIPKHAEPAKREALAKVAAALRQHGRTVRTLTQERFQAATPPDPPSRLHGSRYATRPSRDH